MIASATIGARSSADLIQASVPLAVRAAPTMNACLRATFAGIPRAVVGWLAPGTKRYVRGGFEVASVCRALICYYTGSFVLWTPARSVT